jgi:hypothetical protein
MKKKDQILLLDLRDFDFYKDNGEIELLLQYLVKKNIEWIWFDDYKKRKRFYPKESSPSKVKQ